MSEPDHGWRYTIRGEGDKQIVTLAGELDMTAVDTLQDVLVSSVGRANRVEVDLRSVAFIDSTVLGVLITANNTARAARRDFSITNPRDHVRRVLDGRPDGLERQRDPGLRVAAMPIRKIEGAQDGTVQNSG